MAFQDLCEGWGGPSAISPAQLAALVVRSFPDGTVPGTGESIRATAYAVASAESGRNPMACGDRTIGYSIGLWQVYLVAHPSYVPESLYDPGYNAEAAYQISGGGVNWNPWSVFTSGSYRSYLAEAATELAAATGGAAPPPPPGGTPALPDISWGPALFAAAVIGGLVILGTAWAVSDS